MAPSAGRLKMGCYPLPRVGAQNIHTLLDFSGRCSVVDPCVGKGTAAPGTAFGHEGTQAMFITWIRKSRSTGPLPDFKTSGLPAAPSIWRQPRYRGRIDGLPPNPGSI